jgi:MoaA/NifB/PqqE/SkfB family radical SAM enzyme
MVSATTWPILPDSKIFCNSPWFELQIYWDGGYGICCQESHRLYPSREASMYNVRNMSIAQWMASHPVQKMRASMLGSQHLSTCTRCYDEEQKSGSSRRYRHNQKSVIFMQSFDQSYLQSPHRNLFEQQGKPIMPKDIHIDLGNHCNLACKMCRPSASSKIAVQYKKWNLLTNDVITDWTKDDVVWRRVIDEILEIPDLSNIHFMGGETLLTKKFEKFLDTCILRGKTNFGISFVTNGTIMPMSVLDKLQQFESVNIEVSIESTDQTNSYQRQGTDTDQVLRNLTKLQQWSETYSNQITIRPALSALTIGSYYTLLEYCWHNNLIVKRLFVTYPTYFDVAILPMPVKDLYRQRYMEQAERLDRQQLPAHINRSNPNHARNIVANEIDMCINLLSQDRPENADKQLSHMVEWCRRWDDVYGYNALDIYPEMKDIFTARGY